MGTIKTTKRKTTRPDEKHSRLNTHKDSQKLEELQILKALKEGKPKTMRQIEVETGVRVASQCWAFKRFKKSSRTEILYLGVCPISNSKKVQFHSLTILGELFLLNQGRVKE